MNELIHQVAPGAGRRVVIARRSSVELAKQEVVRGLANRDTALQRRSVQQGGQLVRTVTFGGVFLIVLQLWSHASTEYPQQHWVNEWVDILLSGAYCVFIPCAILTGTILAANEVIRLIRSWKD